MVDYVLSGSPVRVVRSYKLNENMLNGGTWRVVRLSGEMDFGRVDGSWNDA